MVIFTLKKSKQQVKPKNKVVEPSNTNFDISSILAALPNVHLKQ